MSVQDVVMRKSLICILMIILAVMSAMSQENPEDNDEDYVDQKDLIMLIRGEKHKKINTGYPEKGKLIFFAAPILGSNPSLGSFFGLAGTGAMLLGSPDSTNISNLSASILYTTKSQFIASLRGTIMTPGNKWEMLVDLKFSYFSESTYGLGSDDLQPVKSSWNIGGVQTSGLSGAQPMTFNQIRIHYTALRNVIGKFYGGIGYHLDYNYKIKDLNLDLEAPEPVITSHYAYSLHYGFNTENYVSSGVSLDVVYDSRDHTVNPYHGKFLQASYQVNPTFMGSAENYQQVYLETRLYYPLSKSVPRHLIGFWFIGDFTVSGDAPYLHLPASGYDMRNRIGRGYVAGRFRGPSWITAETEYRFPLSKSGLFGAVLFGSITSTSRPAFTIGSESFEKLNLFEAIRPAGGFGLRVMLNRTGRLNLDLDMAFGQDGSKGFYFNVGETF